MAVALVVEPVVVELLPQAAAKTSKPKSMRQNNASLVGLDVFSMLFIVVFFPSRVVFFMVCINLSVRRYGQRLHGS